MALDINAVKAAALGALQAGLAASTSPAQHQQAIVDAIGAAVQTAVAQLQVLNPAGLVAGPAPVTGTTTPGSIG